MRLLLDSHALLWWLIDDGRLSARALDALSSPDAEIFVSAASAWEICTKHRIGKLPIAGAIAGDFETRIASEGFFGLPITLRHAVLAGRLEGAHKDPFDRMLIAQALVEQLIFVSNETRFDGFGVNRLW